MSKTGVVPETPIWCSAGYYKSARDISMEKDRFLTDSFNIKDNIYPTIFFFLNFVKNNPIKMFQTNKTTNKIIIYLVGTILDFITIPKNINEINIVNIYINKL